MIYLYENFATGQLASAIGTGDTTLVLGTGEGDEFPAITNNDGVYGFYIYVTGGGNSEWMLCTQRVSGSNSFTVTRASTPYAFTAEAWVKRHLKKEELESLRPIDERSVAGSPEMLGTTPLYDGEEVLDTDNDVWFKHVPGGQNTWESMTDEP